eukprot:CAMPEP_0202726792 /NCGR_PEP_ID=MMETSP1385-20130828/184790_1 /ASSEMBLY_ACC=CAM_ASM_000861 /TAXON_ID=933848 /ORGANISM="Elphidium margaritaceum" /LENGTH=792 /DNA_ID=CAMNT_0049393019 /DNA_START=44 /DNA_END=2423 /DNA_ORIENTATION=+
MDPLDCSLDELAQRDNQARRRHRKRRAPEDSHDFYAPRNDSRKRGRYQRRHQNYGQHRYQNQNHGHRQYETRSHNHNHNHEHYRSHHHNHRTNDDRAYFRSKRDARAIAPNQASDRADKRVQLPVAPDANYYRVSHQSKTSSTAAATAKYGYVTLIMRGDAYIPGALILAHSLRLRGTQHALICMVTDDVSDRAQQALKLLYDYVVRVPYLSYECKRMKTDKQQEKYKDWSTASFTKWNILQLNALLSVEFDRLLFLDADKIVLQNIDHLLTDRSLQCPAGTFSSPWTSNNNNNKSGRNRNGLIDYYPSHLKHGDEIPAKCIYDALYQNGFVAVGTGMLFEPSIDEYRKFVAMLDIRWISDEYLDNNIDCEKVKLRRLNQKFMVAQNCNSNSDNTVAAVTESTKAVETTAVPVSPSSSAEEEPAAAAVSVDFPEVAEPAQEEMDDKTALAIKTITESTKAVETTAVPVSPEEEAAAAAAVSVDFPEVAEPAQEEMDDKTAAGNKEENEEVEEKKKKKKDDDDDDDANDNDPWRKLMMQERDNERSIGFQNCYSMLDEQSIVFFYYYHRQPWHYIDTKYNFIPWHFKWLENKNDGTLDIPALLHFFGMKPWCQSPTQWRDLQVWWALVYHLITHASAETYEWNEAQSTLMSSFFDQTFLKELPLELYDESAVDNQLSPPSKSPASLVDDKIEEQKRKSRVTCFWCYEMAKRNGVNPQTLIDENKFDEIEWIFHFPVDPKTGQLCCPKLLPLNDAQPTGVDSENENDEIIEVQQNQQQSTTSDEPIETPPETDF